MNKEYFIKKFTAVVKFVKKIETTKFYQFTQKISEPTIITLKSIISRNDI
jgi:hypothetical protein